MGMVIPIQGKREAPKSERSAMETLILTPELIKEWKVPIFQRELRVTPKVKALAAELAAGKYALDGVLTLGKVANDPTTWIIDGQHRLHAFLMSGIAEVISDVRYCFYDTKKEASDAYYIAQDHLARMRPDDGLRALELGLVPLQIIRN